MFSEYCLSQNNIKNVRTRQLVLLVLLVSLTACSLDANIASLSQTITSSFSKSTAPTEVTPASSQNSFTTRGYKVQASLSYQDTNSQGVTTRGLKVNTNVQGSIFKE